MAKYDVLMSCGHEETVELFGKEADRKSKIAYFEQWGLCKECYKKAMQEADKAAGLVFNASILPNIDDTDGSLQVSVWFSGDTKPHKEDIKAIGGYHRGERTSGEDDYEMKRPPLCWHKIIRLDDLEAELSKALDIGAQDAVATTGFAATMNYRLALLRQQEWKEKKDKIAVLAKPSIPAILKGHWWNERIYGNPGNYSFYPDGEKTMITDKQAQELSRYIHEKEEYMNKIHEIQFSHNFRR